MEITSEVKVVSTPPQIIKCPICCSEMSNYEPMPRLEIDFADIAGKIDTISERFPDHSRDDIKIILSIRQQADIIYGCPVEYRVSEE